MEAIAARWLGWRRAAFVCGVGHEPHFDEDAGDVGRLEYGEGGVAGGVLEKPDLLGQGADDLSLHVGGADPGFVADQAGKDVGDFWGDAGRRGRAVAVGGILAPGELRGLFIGSFAGERVDAGALDAMVEDGVRVDRHEEGGALGLGDIDAVFERDEDILLTGKEDAAATAFAQLTGEFGGGGESHMFFVGAGVANGTGVLAAMAGIEDDQRKRGSRVTLESGSRSRAGGDRQQKGGAEAVAHQQTTGVCRVSDHGLFLSDYRRFRMLCVD